MTTVAAVAAAAVHAVIAVAVQKQILQRLLLMLLPLLLVQIMLLFDGQQIGDDGAVLLLQIATVAALDYRIGIDGNRRNCGSSRIIGRTAAAAAVLRFAKQLV